MWMSKKRCPLKAQIPGESSNAEGIAEGSRARGRFTIDSTRGANPVYREQTQFPKPEKPTQTEHSVSVVQILSAPGNWL
jgi:hypothetical protein